MRANEFLNETPLPEPSQDDLAAVHDPKALVIGHGKEATVVRDKRDNSVVKIMGEPTALKNNGYMQYVLMSKKYSASNPYLPQVKSIQQVKSQQGNGVLQYLIKMEELTPYGSTTNQEREEISRNIFHGADLEEILKTMAKGHDVSEYKIEKAIWQGPKTNIVKDPRFINVIRLIWKAKQVSGADLDVHSANFMVRRTANGPQLVITDPLN